MSKKTLVVGASENPERYSNKAIRKLLEYNHPVVAYGLKKGEVQGVSITDSQEVFPEIDTVTMYVGAKNQPPLYNYILSLNPKRIIFNPGAENAEFEKMAQESGIEVDNACTLVMLSVGTY
ncbi:MAG: CoA-binding protein [Bacteroidetes bacterium]|nr:CoA-binding protein [Bacteroidota bacterium]